MSWASRRLTTRLEDEASCLMGLFDVTMPLLYGEGSKAFIRLQQEIIDSSEDQSILAWELVAHERNNMWTMFTGLLAPSVRSFASCSDIESHRSADSVILRTQGRASGDMPIEVSATRLRIRVPFLGVGYVHP
ncbi:Uu.00g054110.m01.CDS01 [Anthostomella pinea]|uniref:Uu.00g054110.m01.CDS01 n=1 Tax=Anthostomella pinea TaxID=933095 RepID=A0AAI8YPQ4_9PEZI|nr:Uu.00g054110.m01.CDS01 [Anthostomella pinea]